MTTLPLADARNRLSEMIDGIARSHDRLTITRHGQPVAVMMSPDDLASMEETLEILAVPGALDVIRQGSREIDSAAVEDWESLRRELIGDR